MVEISNLSFSYSGHAPFLFQSVTETLTDGSWTSITGESGSGKSTLIRLMLGLLKPSAGRSAFLGAPGSVLSPRRLTTRIPTSRSRCLRHSPFMSGSGPGPRKAFSRLSGSEKRIFGTPLFSRSNQLTSAIGRRRLSVRFQGAK